LGIQTVECPICKNHDPCGTSVFDFTKWRLTVQSPLCKTSGEKPLGDYELYGNPAIGAIPNLRIVVAMIQNLIANPGRRSWSISCPCGFVAHCVAAAMSVTSGIGNREENAMDFRSVSALAANAITVHSKIVDILAGKTPIPEVVELFITNFCSFRCPHCHCANWHGDEQSYMRVATLERIFAELESLGVKTIEFGGGGEPLQHPYIHDIFEMLRRRGMRCGIISNGYAVIDNQPLREDIAGVSDWFRVSLDGVADDVYREVHGRDDLSYGKLKLALRDFTTMAARNPDPFARTRLGLKMILQQANKNGLAAVCSEAKAMGADFIQFKWLENSPLSLPEGERRAIFEFLDHMKNSAENDLIIDLLPGYDGESSAQKNEKCALSILHPLIDWDGAVYICAFFHQRRKTHCLGNINRNSFLDLWESDEHKITRMAVNPLQCVSNCPLKRYNPIIEFIKKERYRFPYI
jgi:radical SAM protein with 4Fe4S-binding SPASM domain